MNAGGLGFEPQGNFDRRSRCTSAVTRRRLVTILACAAFMYPLSAIVLGNPTSERAVQELIGRALDAFDDGQRLVDRDPKKAQEHFRRAAQGFESAIAAGSNNPWIEFNLGNCHLQAGDVGHAVLHYLRARLMAPRDPVIADNLSVARSRCPTSIPPARSTQWLETLFFWHFDTSLGGRSTFCLAAYVLFWILLSARSFFPRTSLRVGVALSGVLTLASASSVGADLWLRRNAPPGVVLALDVPVYKGPAATYQRVFEQPLQSGTEFTLRERRGGWWRIELPDGQTGWMEADRAALVVSPGARSPR